MKWGWLAPRRYGVDHVHCFFAARKGGSFAKNTSGLKRLCENKKKKPQVPPLRSPRFPVELGGAGELHAAFSTESRILGRCECRGVGNLGERSGGTCGFFFLVLAHPLYPLRYAFQFVSAEFFAFFR